MTVHTDGWPGPIGLFGHAFLAIDVMTAFTSMITLGMFEKYPRLKCTVLEAGATWIGSWLDRLDYKSEVTEAFSPIKRKPSEYFYRQCSAATSAVYGAPHYRGHCRTGARVHVHCPSLTVFHRPYQP